MFFTGRDEGGVALGYDYLLVLGGDDALTAGYEEDLVGGVGVELILRAIVEVDLGKVEEVALCADYGLTADGAAVEQRGIGCVFFGD